MHILRPTSWLLVLSWFATQAIAVPLDTYLKASNTNAGDAFGRALAISGNTLVVGAPYEDSPSQTINGNQGNDRNHPGNCSNTQDSGAAYVFLNNNGQWSQQAYLKSPAAETGWFGQGVAISGNTIAVSSISHVDIFVRQRNTWIHQATLQSSNYEGLDRFGFSLALDGDTLIVGAPTEDSNASGVNGDQGNAPPSGGPMSPGYPEGFSAGAAYIFVRTGSTWKQQAYLKASNPDELDLFGWSVTVSGDTAVVGATYEDSSAIGVNGPQENNDAAEASAAYVFQRSGDQWSQQAFLKASNSNQGDFFGHTLALVQYTLVVGADGADGGGAAYVFERSTGQWTQQAVLKSSNADPGDRFGFALALSGDSILVGAPREDSQAPTIAPFPANNSTNESGAVYLFSRSGGTWKQTTMLKAPNADPNDSFGVSAVLSGSLAIIGASQEDSLAMGVDGEMGNAPNAWCGELSYQSGAAYHFDLDTSPVSLGPIDPGIGNILDFGAQVDLHPIPIPIPIPKGLLLQNRGTTALTSLTAKIHGDHAANFVLTTTLPSRLSPEDELEIKIQFDPTQPGVSSATLLVTTTDERGAETTQSIHLRGIFLTNDSDHDQDGMNDRAEFLLQKLGFDWRTPQRTLVQSYFDNAEAAGLYTADQLHALRVPAPTIARNPLTGRFTLSLNWQQSTDLKEFRDLPISPDQVHVRDGQIQLELAGPDRAAFFRIEVE